MTLVKHPPSSRPLHIQRSYTPCHMHAYCSSVMNPVSDRMCSLAEAEKCKSCRSAVCQHSRRLGSVNVSPEDGHLLHLAESAAQTLEKRSIHDLNCYLLAPTQTCSRSYRAEYISLLTRATWRPSRTGALWGCLSTTVFLVSLRPCSSSSTLAQSIKPLA